MSVEFNTIILNSELSLFFENILSSIKKVHTINCHIAVNLFQNNFGEPQQVLELASHSLATPIFTNIIDYFEKEYNINAENIFHYKENYDSADFESIILFVDNLTQNNFNTFDLILTTRRIYSSKNIKHITNLFESESFKEILSNNFIKLKKFENVYFYIDFRLIKSLSKMTMRKILYY
jgi:hypothetical protein